MSDGDHRGVDGDKRAMQRAQNRRGRGRRRCPVCRAVASPAFSPFCSARCADIDLGRWLAGAYRIPAVEADEDGESDGRDPAAVPRKPGGDDDPSA